MNRPHPPPPPLSPPLLAPWPVPWRPTGPLARIAPAKQPASHNGVSPVHFCKYPTLSIKRILPPPLYAYNSHQLGLGLFVEDLLQPDSVEELEVMAVRRRGQEDERMRGRERERKEMAQRLKVTILVRCSTIATGNTNSHTTCNTDSSTDNIAVTSCDSQQHRP